MEPMPIQPVIMARAQATICTATHIGQPFWGLWLRPGSFQPTTVVDKSTPSNLANSSAATGL